MADRNVEALTAPLYVGNGANRAKINTDGTFTVEGTATAWNDIRASLIGSKLLENQGTVDYNFSENSVTFQQNGDITDNDDVVLMNFQMPHDAMTSSPFRFHIHWHQVNTNVIQWTLEYRVQSNGGAKDTTWTVVNVPATGTANLFTYTSGTLNQITKLVEIDTTGFGISAVIQIRLTRSDSTGGSVDAYFLDAHYMIDSLGSSEEYVK